MKKLVLLCIVLSPIVLMAAHGEQEAGVPKMVYYQAINFTLFVALLFYFLREPVKAYFASKLEIYHKAIEKAEKVKKDYEHRSHDVREKLTKVKNTSHSSMEEATREAEMLKQNLLKEARDAAYHIRYEAKLMVKAEHDSAAEELKKEIFTLALAEANKNLSVQISEKEQSRLQKEFVDQLQVVP